MYAKIARYSGTLAQAQSTYQRTADLQKRNPKLVSADQVDQLMTAVKVNQALVDNATHGVAQAEAALRDAQSSLDKTTIVSPIDGQVTRLNVEQGETAIQGTLNKDAAKDLRENRARFSTNVRTSLRGGYVGDEQFDDVRVKS